MPKQPLSDDEEIVTDLYDFGGIDHISSPFLVPPNKLLQSTNFTSLNNTQTGFVGSKVTREPYSLFLDQIDTSPVRNLIYFVYNNTDGTSNEYLIRISGANIYAKQVGSSGNTWGTALTGFTPTNTTQPFGFATFENMLHLSNGTDTYQTWTPTGFTAASSLAPKARYLTVFKNRICAINATGGFASRTFFSSQGYVGDPNASSQDPWYVDGLLSDTAMYFDVNPNQKGNVIFGDVVNSNLILHKSNGGLYLYNGSSASDAIQSGNPFFNAPGTSTVSPYSNDQIEGIEFYLNRDGVYAYDGSYPNLISQEVNDYIYNMEASQYSVAPGVSFQKKYYLAIGTTKDKYGNTVTNAVLVYDFILNTWSIYSLNDMPVSWCVYVDANGNDQLLFGDAVGNVYQWNTGIGDNSKPFTAILQTQYLTWGAPERTKAIQSYSYSTNPGANFLLQFDVDWQNKWKTFNTVAGLGVSNTAPGSMRQFKAISFRVIANSASPMLFYGMTLKVNVGSRRNSVRVL